MNIFLQIPPSYDLCSDWWWWSLLMFLLGALLSWLLGLFGKREQVVDTSGIEAERDSWHARATKWEKDYQSLKYRYDESQKNEADLRAALQRCESDVESYKYRISQIDVAPDTDTGVNTLIATGGTISTTDDTGHTGFTGLFPNDNLQIIEGVGPKIESVLKGAGYHTWNDLAGADAADLRTVLTNAGSRFQLADPTSWPHQAKLAAAGDWDELIRYQKFTDGGRETTGDFETDSKFEKLAAKKMGFSSANPQDLKVVEGIGPKIEGLLKDAGINNWRELANTNVDRIQQILNAAGDRYKLAKPGTWPQQAGLAADGQWDALRKLQDELNGGV